MLSTSSQQNLSLYLKQGLYFFFWVRKRWEKRCVGWLWKNALPNQTNSNGAPALLRHCDKKERKPRLKTPKYFSFTGMNYVSLPIKGQPNYNRWLLYCTHGVSLSIPMFGLENKKEFQRKGPGLVGHVNFVRLIPSASKLNAESIISILEKFLNIWRLHHLQKS